MMSAVLSEIYAFAVSVSEHSVVSRDRQLSSYTGKVVTGLSGLGRPPSFD